MQTSKHEVPLTRLRIAVALLAFVVGSVGCASGEAGPEEASAPGWV